MPNLYCRKNGQAILLKRYLEVSVFEIEAQMVAIGKRDGYPCALIRDYRVILKSKVLPNKVIITRNIEGAFPETKAYRMKVKKQKGGEV